MDEKKLLDGELPELGMFHNVPDESLGYAFTSFGGCDMIVSLNEEVVGEIQAITWKEDFFPKDEYAIKGEVILCQFNRKTVIERLSKDKKKFNITISYGNEEGHAFTYRFFGCLFIQRKGSHSIDDLVINEVYVFKAKKIEKVNHQELTEQGIVLPR